MSSHEELVSQFTDVTGADADRAQFYLESSAWQLEVAIASFFENTDGPSNDEPIEIVDQDSNDEPVEIAKAPMDKSSKAKSRSGQRPKFGTLDSLRNQESSSDEEEGQAFYAGGSEHSGQQVLGPGKKNDPITDMFKQCQKQSVPAESRPSAAAQRPNTFRGTGYKLGQTADDSETVSASSSSSSRANAGSITLKLWQDGFTINDRQLRPYNDPANREFLDAIKRGEIPMELRQEVQDAEIHLDMEDHRHENYTPPKVKVKAFTGKGHMLGSPSPAAVGSTSPILPEDQAANEQQARRELNVDSSQPVTMIQIRLADGTNVRSQFNLTHTVADIRQFIINMRPQYATREFVLSTTYPTKELTNESESIEEANLKSAAIMQRLK